MFIVRFQGELHDEPMCHWNFGSPAILGPSRGHPWLLRGSEDPWPSVTVFRREFGASLFFRREFTLSTATNGMDASHSQAYPKVTRKLVRGWHGDNERWGCPGRIAGVGVWTGGPGRRRGISRASPGRAVRRKPIGCGAAGTGGRGATWRCSAGPSGMPPVRAAGGSGWRRARPAGARRSGGSPGGCSRSGRSRARWRSRRC